MKRLVLLCLIIGSVAACSSPFERDREEALRESLIASHRAELAAVAGSEQIELKRDPSDIEQQLTEEEKQNLDQMGGLGAYVSSEINLGSDLTGSTKLSTVRLSLQQAIEIAVKNNLDLQVAQMQPAIAGSRVVQAEAVFDMVFFTNIDYAKLDTPRPLGPVAGLGGPQQSESLELQTGIRKPLTSGGTFEVSTTLGSEESTPSVLNVDRYYNSDILVSLTQPLLRGFGTDLNRSQIVLSRNAQEQQVEELRGTLIDLAANTEASYWDLVFAKQQLFIQTRLLDRTVEDRDRLVQREGFDVTKVRITEANSFVELRRADVIRARQLVRQASDRLKRLMNSPDLPITDETVINPVELPLDKPIRFSLLDAVTTALRNRPGLRVALLQIKDASVRQRVADNARLPELNVGASVAFNGMSESDMGTAWGNIYDGEFIDYILSGQFEVPIGNRGPEALFEQRTLEREASVKAYRAASQQVVLEVKDALRNLFTSYELIGATRAARRAAADSLRAIEAQEDAGVALTPEFLLDLKLQTQQRLAAAETQEIQALTDYNNAISRLYQTMGTLLERNQIVFDSEPGQEMN